MALRGSITVTNGPGVSVRHVRAANRRGLEKAIVWWHKRFAPNHFTVAGAKKYGYQKRKGEGESNLVYRTRKNGARRLVQNRKYYWEKWRRKRTHDPLVYSGESKRRLLRQIRVTYPRGRATAAARAQGLIVARGAMDVERYFYQYDKSKGAPDKYAELIKTTPDEQQTLLRVMNEESGTHLDQLERQRKIVQRTIV